jgi:hypothetical protein
MRGGSPFRSATLRTGSDYRRAVVFKVIEAAQARWRAVNAPHLVALVRAGAGFKGGRLVERPAPDTATEAA